MANTTLKIFRGDTVHRLITFKKNGVALPINNINIFFTAKVNKTDDDDNAVIQKHFVVPDDALASLGKCYFDLDENETDVPIGSYYYDFQMVDDANSIIQTFGVYKLKIEQDITLTIT